ncbi:response regulator transcription factor [Kitasatospora sp. NPDC086791]|uniref:response regulator transcription factor n=1 Tax=Kitasatospora sp. NPDC086791 TaxID=3155178 RepID=UPI00343FE11B
MIVVPAAVPRTAPVFRRLIDPEQRPAVRAGLTVETLPPGVRIDQLPYESAESVTVVLSGRLFAAGRILTPGEAMHHRPGSSCRLTAARGAPTTVLTVRPTPPRGGVPAQRSGPEPASAWRQVDVGTVVPDPRSPSQSPIPVPVPVPVPVPDPRCPEPDRRIGTRTAPPRGRLPEHVTESSRFVAGSVGRVDEEQPVEPPDPRDASPVRVLIVDDHPLFREGLKAALESADGVLVVAEAERVADVPQAVARHRPGVVIMDLSLPDGSGLEAVRRLATLEAPPPVLMLTMSDDDGNLLAALQAGARGYLVKGAGREEVLHAVRTVAAGGAVFGGEVAGRIAALLAGARMREAGQLFPDLTAREAEVLDLVARGLDNRRIARELVVAEKTVRNHITHIFEKLHVATRAEAVARARDMGLGDG